MTQDTGCVGPNQMPVDMLIKVLMMVMGIARLMRCIIVTLIMIVTVTVM